MLKHVCGSDEPCLIWKHCVFSEILIEILDVIICIGFDKTLTTVDVQVVQIPILFSELHKQTAVIASHIHNKITAIE